MCSLVINCEEVPHGQQQPQHASRGDGIIEGRNVGVGGQGGGDSQPDRENPGRVPGPGFASTERDRDDQEGVKVEGGVAHEQDGIIKYEHQDNMVQGHQRGCDKR
jgi:hypothetical protein